MRSSSIQSAVLPAILASSAIFSLLTLPFFFYQAQSTANPDPSLISPNLQPILAKQNRDLTVRYIGGALVASVGVGISVIELHRRQRMSRTKDATTASITTSLVSAPFLLEPDAEDFQPEQTANERILLLELALPDLTNTADEDPTVDSSDLLSLENQLITQLYEEYPTCRIRVNQQDQRLLAIQVTGQFYSFSRLLPTQEAAMEVALQLNRQQHNQQEIVITPVEEQYAVWIRQPEAESELTSILS